MLQAIIFDFDGVIVDSEPLHFQATQSVFASLGVPLDFQTYLQECVGQPDLSNFLRLCAKHQIGADDREAQRLMQAKLFKYRELLAERIQPCAGAIPLIKQAALHFPLAICSGSFRNEIQQLLTTLDSEDLTHYFKRVISIEDVTAGKPDPAGYRLAASHLNALPEFCLAIEDSPAGIIAAKAAGMSVLAVTTTHPREKLTLADHCVSSLDNITVNDLTEIGYAKT